MTYYDLDTYFPKVRRLPRHQYPPVVTDLTVPEDEPASILGFVPIFMSCHSYTTVHIFTHGLNDSFHYQINNNFLNWLSVLISKRMFQIYIIFSIE